MAIETVRCLGHFEHPADAVWNYINDFCDPWHPLIDSMEKQISDSGLIVRRFTIKGEPTVYREALTYLSGSDRVMRYIALDGIEGAESYSATLTVQPGKKAGCEIAWSAEIEADSVRAKEIADGTRTIFEAGLTALGTISSSLPDVEDHAPAPALSPRHLKTVGDPVLGLSVVPSDTVSAVTICILLHGIGGNRRNWEAQLSTIGIHMPAVSLDLRGYGDSELGHAPSLIDDHCADILRVADYLGAEKLVLCGLSFGSWIATSFAMRHSDRLAGLILCGGCTGMSEASPGIREAFRSSRERPLALGKTPADLAPDIVDVIAGPDADDKVIEALLRSTAIIPTTTYLDALHCFCRRQKVFDFSQIDCPTLLMTGTHDRLAPPSEIRNVGNRIHDARSGFSERRRGIVRFEEIKNAGHVCNLENPQAFNRNLDSFLKSLVALRSEEDEPTETVVSSRQAHHQRKSVNILDAALQEFSRNGYSGASMQDIAKRAGVSKPTLYQYFGPKEGLFKAVLEMGRSEFLAPLQDAQSHSLVDALWRFSRTYAKFVLRRDMLSIARLVIAEAERTPELAAQYHRQGPQQAQCGIADFLQVRCAAGELEFTAAPLAAEHLWSLVLSGPRNRSLHFPDEQVSDTDLSRSIFQGLRVFLQAYSTAPERHVRELEHLAANEESGAVVVF
ncbi:MAG: alpha/beta fold hydrolase [Rhizobiaceae bacterium]